MKTFYTSNYEKNGDNQLAVAISVPGLVPSTFGGRRDPSLAPTMDLLTAYHDGGVSHDEYVSQYLSQLGDRGWTPQSVAERFADGTIFLCFDYEDGDASVCHRVILSDWLSQAGVATVSEI